MLFRSVDEAGEGAESAQDISWVSPIARALMRAKVGDVVRQQTPGGERSLTVRDIEYPGD